MTQTDEAKSQIKYLMKKFGKEGQALRLGVKTKGCNGLAYTLDWQPKNTGIDRFDEVVDVKDEDAEMQVIIDNRAVMHVIGSTMDFQRDQLVEEFVFLNPNATGVCGCGE